MDDAKANNYLFTCREHVLRTEYATNSRHTPIACSGSIIYRYVCMEGIMDPGGPMVS